MSGEVYTTDQLCLLARLLGLPLPPSLHPQWTDGDELVADVVATRTLLATGVLALTPQRITKGAALRPTAAVAGGLRAVRDATTVVEVSHTGPDGATQRQVLAGHDRAGLRLREREPDVWVLERAASVTALLDEVVAGLTDGGAGAGRVALAHRLAPDRFVLDEVSWGQDGSGADEVAARLRALAEAPELVEVPAEVPVEAREAR